MSRHLRLAAMGLCLLLAGGCVRGCTSARPPIHLNPNMDYQPRYDPQAASDFFYDGAEMRPPIEDTVALDEPVELGPLQSGRQTPGGAFVGRIPATAAKSFQVPLAVRGAERYAIYCLPCHGDRGDGQGMLFQRAGVKSADFRIARLRQAPDGQLFDTITYGLGLMPAYAAQIPPADRWAIIAHVRALQADSPVVDEGAPAEAAPAAGAPPTAGATVVAPGAPREAPEVATPPTQGDTVTAEPTTEPTASPSPDGASR